MQLFCYLSFILGIASLIYSSIIISYAGIKTAFAWFWVIAGLFGLFSFTLLRYTIKQNIIIPKILKVVVVIIILAGLVLFISVQSVIIYYANQKPASNADYIIVLGAQVRGTKITKSLRYRLDAAIEYIRKNPNTIAIVTGGQGLGEEIAEAKAMHAYMIEAGIGKERILVEDKSTNTNENILFSKQLIEEYEVKQNQNKEDRMVIITTNDFHVFRGCSIAKKKELGNIMGLPAQSDSILAISYYVREAFAVVKDKLTGNW